MFEDDFFATALPIAAAVWSWTIGPWTRSALAAGLGASACLILGYLALPWLRRRCPERVANRLDALYQLHRGKQATPTMGGLFLVAAIAATAGLICQRDDPAIVCTLSTMFALAGVGLADDLAKLRGHSQGLAVATKLVLQCLVVAPIVGWWLMAGQGLPQQTLPLHGPVEISPYGLFGLGLLCVVGSANAMNLTDGLDGLAAGCGAIALAGLVTAMAFRPQQIWATDMPWEAVVLLAAAAGALTAFLWFNRHPARVFMGNIGALACGGLLGAAALSTGQALLLVVVGGVFVAETASVILQRSARRFAGVRPLRCAPLHHHFQLAGWGEPQIVRRFWAAALVCAALGVGLTAATPQPAASLARHSAVAPPRER